MHGGVSPSLIYMGAKFGMVEFISHCPTEALCEHLLGKYKGLENQKLDEWIRIEV